MAKNKNLRNAKKNAKDEFYTVYKDISAECSHYRKHFPGKVVYCNCDDPTWSNFWRYFHNNFKSLGLKKLIATHYAPGEEESYAMVYEGGNDFHMEEGKCIPIHADEGFLEKEDAYCAGDFRSKDCIALLEESDIVVTNPPFSLFRQYVTQLMEYEKHFIIIGNQNAITYKEIFPLVKENKIWWGASIHSGDRMFYVPDNYELNAAGCGIDENGRKFIRIKGVRWYTNLDIKMRHDGLWHRGGKFDQTIAHKYYEGFEWRYLKYDNYDAINVDKTKEIPIDYSGVMGVPITWLDKYNPDEFEIIGFFNNYSPETADVSKGQIYGDPVHVESTTSLFRGPVINGKAKYFRILIQNKNPIAKADDKGY